MGGVRERSPDGRSTEGRLHGRLNQDGLSLRLHVRRSRPRSQQSTHELPATLSPPVAVWEKRAHQFILTNVIRQSAVTTDKSGSPARCDPQTRSQHGSAPGVAGNALDTHIRPQEDLREYTRGESDAFRMDAEVTENFRGAGHLAPVLTNNGLMLTHDRKRAMHFSSACKHGLCSYPRRLFPAQENVMMVVKNRPCGLASLRKHTRAVAQSVW